MAENKKSENGNGASPATEAQYGLLGELCDELGFDMNARSNWITSCTIEEASKRIHTLKEMKVRDQALRSQDKRVNGFDKISFAMIYKLVWKAQSEAGFAVKPTKRQFIDAAIGEYELFKAAQDACKEHVAEGGQQ